VSKSTWDEGPWQTEPDRKEWRDEATGLPCLIVRSPVTGSLCGYVGVPPDHPWHGKDHDAIDVQVHGGLTFSAPCDKGGLICHVPQPGEPADVWWLGFDCAHAFDLMPGINALLPERHLVDCTYRDMAYVERQCAQLAAQVAESRLATATVVPTIGGQTNKCR